MTGKETSAHCTSFFVFVFLAFLHWILLCVATISALFSPSASAPGQRSHALFVRFLTLHSTRLPVLPVPANQRTDNFKADSSLSCLGPEKGHGKVEGDIMHDGSGREQ